MLLILPSSVTNRKLALDKLTGAINAAKDSGGLETLRQIADNPAGYVMRHGWTAIDLGDTGEVK